MEVLSKSTEDTKELARSIAKRLKKGDILALYGDLGSGKTTFTSYLVHALGIEKRVQSPTFVLIRKYNRDSIASLQSDRMVEPQRHSGRSVATDRVSEVNHVDLYRLETENEIKEIGLEEIINEGGITVIEWPEKAEKLLPKETIKINFTYEGENERKITVQNLN